jgi:hypothetical protein
MFIQVIRGRAKNPPALREHMDRWRDELAPGADGWLGATAGVTDDGDFIAVVRFESEEQARHNSDRAEQTKWWDDFSADLEGEATFLDSTDAELWMNGGSDEAGFVQVIQGRAKDPKAVRDLFAEDEASQPGTRPDVLGGTIAWHEGGLFTNTVYFTSEKEARKGEANPTPEEQESMRRWMELVDDVSYTDLRDPWFTSA